MEEVFIPRKSPSYKIPLRINHHPATRKTIPRTEKTDGVVLCDQARMLDLNSRNAVFVEKAPAALVAEAVDLIIGFVELPLMDAHL